MWNIFKKIFLSTKDRYEGYKIPAIYSINIPNDSNEILKIDKKFIEILLNFTPDYNSLKCEIQRFDTYDNYIENVRAFISCDVMENDWIYKQSDLNELNKLFKELCINPEKASEVIEFFEDSGKKYLYASFYLVVGKVIRKVVNEE